MIRLNRKKKLIVAIAITLIIIILAIVITTNIISNNSQIANEGYFATTANASSNLVASYIKKGITIGGITGTLEILDTSDATATSEDIAKGKTAYVNGEKITGTYVPSYNYTFTDSLGNTVKVPGGFEVVNPEDNVTDGIIIEDVNAGDENTKGSQFVWIPVGDVITDTNGSTTTITLGRYTFNESTGNEELKQSADNWQQEVTIEQYYKETTNGKAKDLKSFINKSLSSGGFYIGRYETGDALAIDEPREVFPIPSLTNPKVCKAGVYPYTWLSDPTMYDNSNFEDDLINSYAYDTTLVYIQKFSGDSDYSITAGSNEIVRCGESSDVKCNIYDIAGNAEEYTTEYSTHMYGTGTYRNAGKREHDDAGGFMGGSAAPRLIIYL